LKTIVERRIIMNFMNVKSMKHSFIDGYCHSPLLIFALILTPCSNAGTYRYAPPIRPIVLKPLIVVGIAPETNDVPIPVALPETNELLPTVDDVTKPFPRADVALVSDVDEAVPLVLVGSVVELELFSDIVPPAVANRSGLVIDDAVEIGDGKAPDKLTLLLNEAGRVVVVDIVVPVPVVSCDVALSMLATGAAVFDDNVVVVVAAAVVVVLLGLFLDFLRRLRRLTGDDVGTDTIEDTVVMASTALSSLASTCGT
jgi:hypothetical protein